jgi:hypothetical protein
MDEHQTSFESAEQFYLYTNASPEEVEEVKTYILERK